jgi:hypothetical protein
MSPDSLKVAMARPDVRQRVAAEGAAEIWSTGSPANRDGLL